MDAKVEEFINLKQGLMLVRYYSMRLVRFYIQGEATFMKCVILNGGKCLMDSNAFYSCGKPGQTMKDCPNRRSQEQGKERVQPNFPSEEAPRRHRFFTLKSMGAGEGTADEVLGP